MEDIRRAGAVADLRPVESAHQRLANAISESNKLADILIDRLSPVMGDEEPPVPSKDIDPMTGSSRETRLVIDHAIEVEKLHFKLAKALDRLEI